MSDRVLITGATGFAGRWLADHLLAEGREVVGTIYGGTPSEDFPSERISLHPCDLGDMDAIRAVVSEIDPQEIYHVAAQAVVAIGWQDPWMTFRVNAMGTVNLLEACRCHEENTRILLVSSASVYGLPPVDGKLMEDMPLRPNDPYGVSKVSADQAAVLYHQAYGINVLRARAFNHIGPGPADKHAVGNFARQITEMEPAGGGDISVGNLTARRNFTDVRDVVRAYALLMERGEPGEAYNVCGDTVLSIEQILDRLIALSPFEFRKVQDPERMRPVDTPLSDGANIKLKQATGWKPRISFDQSLSDLLEYWRKRERDNPPTTSAGKRPGA